MGNNKDIGNAIHDKLQLLDKMPTAAVWESIEMELKKKKKRRAGIIFFWSKAIGLFVLPAALGFYFYFSRNNDTTPAVPAKNATTLNEGKENNAGSAPVSGKFRPGTENNTGTHPNTAASSNNDANSTNVIPENKSEANAISVSHSATIPEEDAVILSKKAKKATSQSNHFAKMKKQDTSEKSSSRHKNSKGEKTTASEETITGPDLKSLTTAKNTVAAKEQDVAKKDTTTTTKPNNEVVTIYMYPKDKTEKDSTTASGSRKLDADVFVSPTHYDYFSGGSVLDSRLDTLSQSSKIKYSYGVGLSYELSKRFTVRIGYSKINLSYITKNAPINTSNYTGIEYGNNMSNQLIYTASNGAERMDITQEISYAEIPIEFKYRLLDTKFGISASSGFSYLMLDSNNISIKTDNGMTMDIGKTAFMAKTSLSFNIGLELDYELFKNTRLFVEPMLNYQIKSFESQNYKPYFIGAHIGIRYSILNK